jgi:calcineurin-like phosphoesterase family protein
MAHLFTSDTHFGHAMIIEYAKRPFKDVNEMNEALIANWNARVKPGDTVYHLGDFGFGPTVRLIRPRLNGNIRLILGNHDKIKLEDACLFTSIDRLSLISVEKQRIVLCHYAMRTWQFSGRGGWMLYGHSHGNLEDDPNALSLDVGVDCWDYAPVSFQQIARRMEKKIFIPVDHHGKQSEEM